MNHSPRVLKEAKRQAYILTNRIRTAYQQKRLTSWEQLEKQFSIIVPPIYREQPFTWANLGAGVNSFCQYWEMSYEIRLGTELQKSRENIIKIDKSLTTFGEITLKPEQNGAFKTTYNALFHDNEHCGLFDWYGGAGKTMGGCAIIAQAIKDGILEQPDVKWRLHPFMIICPPIIAEEWRRALVRFGLSQYLRFRKILIFPDGEFQAEHGRMYVNDVEDIYNGETELVWNPVLVPIFVIIDECHRFCNPKSYRTRCILALKRASKGKTKFLLMSATPMEKVNDAFLFTILCDKVFNGMKVDEDTFRHFASIIDSRPDKPNREALKRLRGVLDSNIFSIPYIKPDHKAINMVKLVDFSSPKHKEIYDTSMERYREACRKAGKNTLWGPLAARIALNIHRKTVEPLRADFLAERSAQNYHNKTFATAVGCAFKETIANVAFQLVDKYNIPRDEISVVWGGRKEYKKEELLSEQEMDSIFKEPDSFKMEQKLRSMLADKTMRKRLRLSLRYLQDKAEHLEDSEAQSERHDKLKALKLVGTQSANTRQIEIDKYQNGESKILLFTIAIGGASLSFDKDKPHLWTREGLFTPVYSGKEFKQLLGRLVRRMSIADAIQYICMMRNTVEERHVAPILDEKLKCIAEITNRNFDIVDLLLRDEPIVQQVHAIRDIQQATIDAEQDNTIVADFTNKDEDDEEENDDELDKIIPE